MNNLVRNTTFPFSRGADDQYEPLHQENESWGEANRGRRALSMRKKEAHTHTIRNSFSYRRDRARRRQVFLKTYKLASMDTLRRSRPKKLKKLVVKVKTVVVSIVSFLRIGSFKSCDCKSAICASSPMRIRK